MLESFISGTGSPSPLSQGDLKSESQWQRRFLGGLIKAATGGAVKAAGGGAVKGAGGGGGGGGGGRVKGATEEIIKTGAGWGIETVSKAGEKAEEDLKTPNYSGLPMKIVESPTGRYKIYSSVDGSRRNTTITRGIYSGRTEGGANRSTIAGTQYVYACAFP